MKKILNYVGFFALIYAIIFALLMIGTVIATGVYSNLWFGCFADVRYYGYNAILAAVLIVAYTSVIKLATKLNYSKK